MFIGDMQKVRTATSRRNDIRGGGRFPASRNRPFADDCPADVIDYVLLAFIRSSAKSADPMREPSMLRRISIVAACAVVFASIALPASGATSHARAFGIPGVYGVRAWGTYDRTGASVRVTVCVQDTSRNVYGGAAVALAFDSGYRHHGNLSAVIIGYSHTQCQAMATRYTSHLVVEALSGNKNGSVRQHSRPKRVY